MTSLFTPQILVCEQTALLDAEQKQTEDKNTTKT